MFCERNMKNCNCMKLNMKKNIKIVTVLLFILCSIGYVSARKASSLTIPIKQPNGYEFYAKIYGDEWCRVSTTINGEPILKDSDGWWYYCTYDQEGRKISTGIKVSNQGAPTVKSGLSSIPFDKIRALTAERRVLRPANFKNIGERLQLSETTKSNGTQTNNGLIILVAFSDVSFQYTKQDFEDLINKPGYSKFGGTGCAIEYFNAQFGGKINFDFDITDIVTLTKPRSYYGENDDDGYDKNPEEMVKEACLAVDSYIDFAKYDNDGDGVVDNVFIFFAGGDEAELDGEECIWSHAYYIYSGTAKIDLVLDGKRIDGYACTSELTRRTGLGNKLAGIGTFCHEFSHTLGLMDVYDTDYEGSGGTSVGLWQTTCLMDAGNQNNESNTPPNYNAIERVMVGLSTPTVISQPGNYSLGPIHETNECFRINTDHNDEFFLIEYRKKTGWDKYIGGEGLLVYHCDYSQREAGHSDVQNKVLTAEERWWYNEVNCVPDRMCAQIITCKPAASGTLDIFFPIGQRNYLEASRLKYWSGNTGETSLKNIVKSSNRISFEISGKFAATTDVFQRAVIVNFECDAVGNANLSWGVKGSTETETAIVASYGGGKYSYTIEDLNPAVSYVIGISYKNSTNDTINKSLNVTTKSFYTDYPVHIELLGVQGRNTDGSFQAGSKLPLQLVNANRSVEEVRWYFDSERIYVGEDGYFTLTESGKLDAHIYYKNGEIEIIRKEIVIK